MQVGKARFRTATRTTKDDSVLDHFCCNCTNVLFITEKNDYRRCVGSKDGIVFVGNFYIRMGYKLKKPGFVLTY